MALREVNVAERTYPSFSYVESLDNQLSINEVFELAMMSPHIRQHIQMTQSSFSWNVLKEPKYKKLILTQLEPVKKTTSVKST